MNYALIHIFARWAENHLTCPLCRRPMWEAKVGAEEGLTAIEQPSNQPPTASAAAAVSPSAGDAGSTAAASQPMVNGALAPPAPPAPRLMNPETAANPGPDEASSSVTDLGSYPTSAVSAVVIVAMEEQGVGPSEEGRAGPSRN